MGAKIISKGRVSATRGAAILGLSPYMTQFAAWQNIMERRQPGFNAAHGYVYEEFDGNVSTRWGKAFESAIINLAEERYGRAIHDREYHAFHSEHDYIHCYLDGVYGHKVHTVAEIEAAKIILHEGKTTTSYGYSDKWGEPGTDKIPIEYQIQTQHQMLCTGADECIVSVLVFPKRPEEWEEMGWAISDRGFFTFGDFSPELHLTPLDWAESLAQMGFFHQYTVKADPDLHAVMLERYQKWWTRHVIGETPPEPESYGDIRSMITAPVGTIVVDRDTARWFKEYKDIGAEIGSTGNLAKRKEQLKVTILDHARVLEKTLDDESTDKWVFRDDAGKKLGSYSRNKNGSMVFR